MRRTTMLAVLLTTFTWAAAGGAQGEPAAPAPEVVPAGPIRVLDSDVSVGPALEAQIDLSLGEVVLRGEDVDRIYVRLMVFCERKDVSKCEKYAKDVAVAGEVDGNKIALKVKGVNDAWLRRLRFRLEVRVPKSLAVSVHVHEGQIRIDDVVASAKVEVDDGTIDVNVADSEVGELKLTAGGKVTVEAGGQSLTAKGTLSGELHWIRPGRFARLEAKADIGDVRVVLR